MSTPRKLYRSETDRLLAGVAGGLAAFLGIDATIVRIVWLLLCLPLTGMPVVAYMIMWVMIPRESRLGAAPADTAADALDEARERIRRFSGGTGGSAR